MQQTLPGSTATISRSEAQSAIARGVCIQRIGPGCRLDARVLRSVISLRGDEDREVDEGHKERYDDRSF